MSLSLFPKLKMFQVAVPPTCKQVVLSAEVLTETQNKTCVPCLLTALQRYQGEGWATVMLFLPLPRHWKGKTIFILNLAVFYSFYPNLGNADDCKGGEK